MKIDNELKIVLSSYLLGIFFIAFGIKMIFGAFFYDFQEVLWNKAFFGGFFLIMGFLAYLFFVDSSYGTPKNCLFGRWFLYCIILVMLFWSFIGNPLFG